MCGFSVPVALPMLVVSGLFIRSLFNVARVDLGMTIDRVVAFSVSPSQNGYPAERSAALFRELEQRLNALPGVASASVSLVPLLTDSNWDNSVTIAGFDASPETNTVSSMNFGGPRFFETLSIPLLAGRSFTRQDTDGRPKVAIVNRTFAEKFEMGDAVVGKRMARATCSDLELDIEIVGLVADARYSTVKDEPPPQFFVPIGQTPALGSAVFYARSKGDRDTLMRAILPLVSELEPNLPVERPAMLERVSRQTVVIERLMGTLASLFAGLATLLAATGLFGELNFSMAQRSTELGLRAALGASPGRLVLLLAVVLLAGWLPARRAASVQPVQALRYE